MRPEIFRQQGQAQGEFMSGRRTMNGRGRVIGTLLAAVVLAAAVGWVVGTQIESPAEVASRTAPPAAAPILVPAEQRVLSTDIVTRGTARFGSPQQVAPAPSALKAGFGVAARLPVAGSELREGDVLLVLSGRPVFLLQGAQPAYRDLGRFLQGGDVLQLEEALERLGFATGIVDGIYDKGTEDGVAALYAKSGFTAFTASADQLAEIRAREADESNARIDLIGARESVAAAEAALEVARAAHARAQDAFAAAPQAGNTAIATVAAKNRAAAAEVAWKQAVYDSLVGTEASAAEIAAAKAEIALAQANLEVVRLSGEQEIAAAQAAIAAARADVSATAAEVRTAQTALSIARDALTVRSRQTDTAAADLAAARSQAGVQVPADEVVFVPRTPVRVSDVVSRSDQTGGPLVTVTDSVVAIDGSLRLEEASLVRPDMAVLIDEPDLGIKATGRISRVAPAPGTNGVDGFHVYFEVIVDEPPASLVGASVRLTVPVESTGASVLAVPVSAVTLAADGSSRVERKVRDGPLEFVTVEPGLAADGYVAVTPVDGTLEAGDLVVVGFDQQADGRR